MEKNKNIPTATESLIMAVTASVNEFQKMLLEEKIKKGTTQAKTSKRGKKIKN